MNEEHRTTALAMESRTPGSVDRTQTALARLVKIGARAGVSGLVGGLGLGTLVASVTVLLHPKRIPRLIRASAIAGVPLGGALALLGVASLSLWSPLISIVNALTALAAGLGAVVIVLLVAGFFLGAPGGDGAEP